MADASSVDVILEFLRRNQFTRAEAALRNELGGRPDSNGFLQKLTLQEKESGRVSNLESGKEQSSDNQGPGSQNKGEVYKDLIVKEIDCWTDRTGSENKRKNGASSGEGATLDEATSWDKKSFTLSRGSENPVFSFHPRNFDSENGLSVPYQNDAGPSNCNLVGPLRSEQSSCEGMGTSEIFDEPALDLVFSGEKRNSWLSSAGKGITEPHRKVVQTPAVEPKELDQPMRTGERHGNLSFKDNPWSNNKEFIKPSSVMSVITCSKGHVLTNCDVVSASDKNEGKNKVDMSDTRVAIKEQVDEVGRALYLGKQNDDVRLGFHLSSGHAKEEFPRLPPVKLKWEDKSLNVNWEAKQEQDVPNALYNADSSFLMGSNLDVPIGQEISSSGGKKVAGGNWLSVSQGITEDTSDLVRRFATIGDGLGESLDNPNDYWDSDEYEDDEDVGYVRQPIEDEDWFLAHEVDYPSDNEKGTVHGSVPDQQERGPTKDDEDQSFAEEDSYFSGEHYLQGKTIEPVTTIHGPTGLSVAEIHEKPDETEIGQYGQMMDEEELILMQAEPVWQGFVTDTDNLVMLSDQEFLHGCGRPCFDDNYLNNDQDGAVRSIGVGINNETVDSGFQLCEDTSGGELEYFYSRDIANRGLKLSRHETDKRIIDRSQKDKRKSTKDNAEKFIAAADTSIGTQVKDNNGGPFSFPKSLKDVQLLQAESSKSVKSNHCRAVISNEKDEYINNLTGTDDLLATWRRKSSDTSSVRSSRDEGLANAVKSANSSPASLSNYAYDEGEHAKKQDGKTSHTREEGPEVSLEDEEASAVQEQIKQIKAQEEEFETFNLKIVHRKNRTGFEEDKNFHVVLNSVIAGRYHVTEYLGSAAFSKAIQAHDLCTGMDVCVKIIKNNKDFFDQSLDEIKLLKYINKHDPADKFHVLRLYDYFYYKEHLLIVCELLKANLYEFHKFNRESGGEVYFTMPRLQSITIQCLEALQFLHGLGLIHCDLKPENILVKSYSRCEVKVIDLGSSCFETDHLCSYVQSRSYRAPEVILGLPYNKQIDIWSLGCILAELCTGNVLFQNDSSATLLARVIGIIGPIDQEMFGKGRDTYKYFTKNQMLFERNQESNKLEYLIPKRSSIRHRMPMGDEGFVDFVTHLLVINPKKRPSAAEALKHPWLAYPYDPISA